MFRKRRRHQYVINGGKIPRRTEYRIRKAQQAREAQQAPGAQLSEHWEMGRQSSESTDDEYHQNPNTLINSNSENITFLRQLSHDSSNEISDTSSESIKSSPGGIICDLSSDEARNHTNGSLCSEHWDSASDAQKSDENDTIHQLSDEEETMYSLGAADEFQSDLNQMSAMQGARSSKIPLLNNKLCPCSQSTEGDALLYCLALGIRHNLTWVAIVDILKMINLLYGYEAVSASKYYLQKLFEKQKSAKYHLYCSLCETYLGMKDDVGVECRCECSSDSENVDIATSFFVSVDLAEQFRSLMQREEVANEILTYRFQRRKINDEAYEDIFDGEAYKKLCRDGEMLGNPYNFSYTFNTDGVQMGKSTKNSAWPIFISINELSPHNRKKNMMFAGVWVGKSQPNMRIFLKPFVEEANKLSVDGFCWTDFRNIEQHSRVFPLCCVVDSAARYKLLNLTSYTGYFGCTFCYQRAEHTKTGRRFTIPANEAPLRTHKSMLEDMNESFKQRDNPDKKKKIIRGCKGYTPLVLMKYLDLDTSFVVDSMHNSFLGVAKSHTGNLLTTCRTDFYIGSPEKISDLCDRLSSIRTPSTITRPPRSIEEWKMWKASEWRSWLLFYVLVCLYGLIPSKYIHHLALFSTSLHLLLQKSITYADIELANQYLRRYVFLTQQYFGKTAMLYNYHLLLHLCRSVLNYGPLWTHTAFPFEGENHHFMQMRTSSGHVTQQLVRRYSIFTAYPTLCDMYASSDKPIEFLNDITGKSLKSFTRQDECVLVGKGNVLPFTSVENYVQPFLTEYQNLDVISFKKMFYGGIRYCTSSYAEGKKHDDSYISLGPNLKARIENIVQIKLDGEMATVILLVTPYTVKLPDFLKTNLVNVTHVKEVLKTGDMVAIKPTQIFGQCVYMELDSRHFVADIPFGCHGD